MQIPSTDNSLCKLALNLKFGDSFHNQYQLNVEMSLNVAQNFTTFHYWLRKQADTKYFISKRQWTRRTPFKAVSCSDANIQYSDSW